MSLLDYLSDALYSAAHPLDSALGSVADDASQNFNADDWLARMRRGVDVVGENASRLPFMPDYSSEAFTNNTTHLRNMMAQNPKAAAEEVAKITGDVLLNPYVGAVAGGAAGAVNKGTIGAVSKGIASVLGTQAAADWGVGELSRYGQRSDQEAEQLAQAMVDNKFGPEQKPAQGPALPGNKITREDILAAAGLAPDGKTEIPRRTLVMKGGSADGLRSGDTLSEDVARIGKYHSPFPGDSGVSQQALALFLDQKNKGVAERMKGLTGLQSAIKAAPNAAAAKELQDLLDQKIANIQGQSAQEAALLLPKGAQSIARLMSPEAQAQMGKDATPEDRQKEFERIKNEIISKNGGDWGTKASMAALLALLGYTGYKIFKGRGAEKVVEALAGGGEKAAAAPSAAGLSDLIAPSSSQRAAEAFASYAPTPTTPSGVPYLDKLAPEVRAAIGKLPERQQIPALLEWLRQKSSPVNLHYR